MHRIGGHFHNHWLFIASPLPDELGVALLSSITDVRARSLVPPIHSTLPTFPSLP